MQKLGIILDHVDHDCELCGCYQDNHTQIMIDDIVVHEALDDGHYGGSHGPTSLDAAAVLAFELLGGRVVMVSETVSSREFDPVACAKHGLGEHCVSQGVPVLRPVLEGNTLYMYSGEYKPARGKDVLYSAYVLEHEGQFECLKADPRSPLGVMAEVFQKLLPGVEVITEEDFTDYTEDWDDSD